MRDDTISRAAAIDALAEYIHNVDRVYSTGKLTHEDCKDAAHSVLDGLPSAQRWIPCSERMPEEHEWIGTKRFGTTISNEVYVTFEATDGERFATHISFQNGKLSLVDEQRMKVWYKGAKPIAWCPLPEPYKEGEQP